MWNGRMDERRQDVSTPVLVLAHSLGDDLFDGWVEEVKKNFRIKMVKRDFKWVLKSPRSRLYSRGVKGYFANCLLIMCVLQGMISELTRMFHHCFTGPGNMFLLRLVIAEDCCKADLMVVINL